MMVLEHKCLRACLQIIAGADLVDLPKQPKLFAAPRDVLSPCGCLGRPLVRVPAPHGTAAALFIRVRRQTRWRRLLWEAADDE